MKSKASGPGWVPTIAALIALSLTLSAAYWQYGRAKYKTQLREQYHARLAMPPLHLNDSIPQPDAASFRKVRVSGQYVPDKAILLDNKVREGVPGYEVVAPLRIAGSDRSVLIDRGWIGGGRDRSHLPTIQLPHGLVMVTGTAILPGRGALELSDDVVEGRVWQNLNLSRFRDKQQLNVLDFIVHEESEEDDGLNRNWPEPGFGIQIHQSYTGQWLLFSVLIIFFYFYYGFVRKKPGEKK
jgi:surfeit locus 1 family protein